MFTPLIGPRIKARREELKLSQEELSTRLGFRDRQTLSTIETSERRVSAEELLLVSQLLERPVEFFTDPFLLVGEGKFSWRQGGVPGFKLTAYEETAGRLIAAFRVLAPEFGQAPRLLRHRLGLEKSSTFEDAIAAAEAFAAEMKLGDVPAQRLATVMEQELNILVLMIDPEEGVSGAACRLPNLDAVLINRNEVPGRRHYDLAHELFHILTWDSMPPARVEDNRTTSKDRVEQLADNFGAALLMPASVLARFGSWHDLDGDALVARLNSTAEELQVTAAALKWRLVTAGLLKRAVATGLDDKRLRHNGQTAVPSVRPPLFSKSFVELVARALEEGRLSVRRTASLLGLTVDDLPDLFAAHGVSADVEL
jgi:Zn-dependent peptidase ImmA (M78 family)/transcriptional regulator with XRE-family HTH domain